MSAAPARIIDAHHHLWDLSACHYPWLMARGERRFFGDPTPIQTDYRVDDFRADFAGLPVTKSVHIQVGTAPEDAVRETLWLEATAEREGLPNAIVAFGDLTSDMLARTLDAHAAATRLRGIRQIVGRSAEEDARTGTAALLESDAFARGLRELERRDLSFDLQLTPPLMPAAARVFARHDGLRLALCHAGSPSDFSAGGLARWRDGLGRFAELPNTICKLSGFVMFDHDWHVESLRHRVRMAIDAFGPHRVAFGSNFPVDKLHAGYGTLMDAYFDITAGDSDPERAAMFADTAEAFYRI